MRVLHILSSVSVNSGIANVVMNYYRNIDREQVQFDCLVFSDAPNSFESEINELGGKVYFFTQPGLKTYFKAKKELKEFFKSHDKKYDIIHCHEILVAKIVFKYARKYGNVKCISHSHSAKLSESRLRALRNRFIILGLKSKSDYCFACSKMAGQNAFGNDVLDNTKFLVIPNAINLGKYRFNEDDRDRIREEFNVQNKFVLGNVGRLSKEKNQAFAIDILASVLSRDREAALILVGKGDLEENLKEYAKQKGVLDKVIFTGIRQDIPQILSAMDYFVFPSRFEGFGITLLEAQANGLNSLCFENMPDEVKVSDKLFYMPVASNREQWADIILSNNKKSDREKYCDILKEIGYDIVEQAQKLKTIYFKIKDETK